ncbi:MAG: hypothetical protein JST02_05455, partial [Bacteroidetes bacterium]|nr:hypothetical protein [Bacteroidota bacterium]
PDQFILLQNYTKFVDDCIGDWPENDNDVVMHYSTPLMKIHCIVLKNNSSETITINSLKLIQTHSDSLRSKNEDAAFSTKSKAITTQIKIAPNSDIVIPASISFTPLNKIKPPNTDISFKSDAESYYYGEVSYLDSLTINGFTFPFKQFSDRIVLMGFRDGKTFSTDGSCPYLYSYVPSNKHYALEKQILYKLNSKEKEKYDTILLKNPNRKMLIKEIDPEDSFIDEIFILCVDKNKKEIRYFSNNDLLKKKDGKYLQLSTNDQVFLEFENFISVNDNNKYYLVSNGYYLPHKGKSNYVKPAPTIIH